jgi:PAS domain S-box-containing protein
MTQGQETRPSDVPAPGPAQTDLGAAPPVEVLLQHLPDSVTVLDRKLRILYLNWTVAPRTIPGVLGHSALEYMPPEHHAPFTLAVERAFETGTVQYVEVATATGRYWETRLVPLLRDGGVHAVMGIGAEVTRRKQHEEQLRQTQKLEALGQLTAGIAHNFNNMLMVMLTNLALCRAKAPEAALPRLHEVEQAAQRAADMVRDLMGFARNRTATAQLEPVDLVLLVERVVAMSKTTFERKIDVRMRVEGEIAPVFAHSGRIEQTVFNLMLNARDALTSQPSILPRIELVLDMDQLSGAAPQALPAVRLRIRDNGPGMTSEVRSRIFEPFFTTKEGKHGTGLGLAMAYGTMNEHGGSITCESAPGAGATFTLLLPAVQRG